MAGMQSMPAELVVEETCKLFLQLPPSWSITSSEHVVAFVQQMAEHFDQTLQDLHMRAAVVTQPMVTSYEWDDERSACNGLTEGDGTESTASSQRFGQSSVKMRVEAQRLFSDEKLMPRRTRSVAAWAVHQKRASRKEIIRHAADNLRKVLLLFGLIFQMFVIPLISAFRDIPVSWHLILVEYIFDSIFWINIFLHLRDPFGWYPDFFEFASSRKQYVQGYFWVELFAVLPIELGLFAVFRDLRVLGGLGRLNRLLTVIHFSHSFDHVLRMIWRGLNPSSIQVYWLASLSLAYFHCMACLFYGTLSSDMKSFREFLSEEQLGVGSVVADYLTSFDWTVKMSTGFAAQYPNTDLENGISLCVALSGFAVYSYVLGMVIYIISQQDAPLTLLRTKLEMVHDYMNYIKAPKELAEEILSYYRQVWKMCHSFDTERQDFLEDLPPELQQRIQFTINYNLVQRVNIFQGVKDDMLFIADIVSALKPRVCVPEQVVVHAQSANSEMYFVMKGELDAMDANGNVVATLKEGQYFGELCLLYGIPTTHTIIATTTCYLYTLSQKDFDYLMEQYPECLKEILGNALNQIEEKALHASIDANPEVPVLADGQLLDRLGNPIPTGSPKESARTGTTHDESRATWGHHASSERVDPLAMSQGMPPMDMSESYRFGAVDVRDVLRDRPVGDVMDLLADMRAEAKAVFQEQQLAGPPRKDVVIPAVRPPAPGGEIADPLAIGNMSHIPGLALGNVIAGNSGEGSLGQSIRSLSQSLRQRRPPPGNMSKNFSGSSRRASVSSERRSSISMLASRRTSLGGARRSSLGGKGGHLPVHAVASASGLPPMPPRSPTNLPATPMTPIISSPQQPLRENVRDGLLRWAGRLNKGKTVSELAKERTRTGMTGAMEVRCVTTFEADGVSVSPQRAPSRLSASPPAMVVGNADSPSSASNDFTTAQETLQLRRTRFKDAGTPRSGSPSEPT